MGSEAVTLHGVGNRVCVWKPESGELKISEPKIAMEAKSRVYTRRSGGGGISLVVELIILEYAFLLS